MRFQVGICPEWFQLYQIKTARLSAIINFYGSPDIYQIQNGQIPSIIGDNMHNNYLENYAR